MSNVSHVESGAKYSLAMSILNKVRHWLEGREGKSLDVRSRSVVMEAVKMGRDYMDMAGDKKEKKRGINYSIKSNMRSLDDRNMAISSQIAEAIYIVNKRDTACKMYSAFETVMSNETLDKISEDDMKNSIKLVRDCIWVLGDVGYERLTARGELRGVL
jgi:hypothetical protein